ncbi:hypothetical protein EG349_04975 [Chryseobacterium shandongense]|uniref:Uncharacterized protein n=1 Tax=Chryseobacterium shandongense TaxID=1493872 RepID=A0AAD0YEP7_9FLAO|nr:hypothetical protein EG349_04975 [Chryseobacterium shandongense]
MKRKVFRYKFVYWIAILINVIFSVAFGFGIYNRIVINSIFDIYSAVIFIILGLSLLSLIFLIKKVNYLS